MPLRSKSLFQGIYTLYMLWSSLLGVVHKGVPLKSDYRVEKREDGSEETKDISRYNYLN